MASRRTRLESKRTTTLALVARVVAYGEADAVITLFTEELGKISALGRGARKSRRRLALALEPMHTHSVVVDERPGAALFTLVESRIERPRFHLVASLERLEAAGQALRWVRASVPERTREAGIWEDLTGFLDRLDTREGEGASPPVELATLGLRLVGALGYGLDFDACIRCGRGREAGRAGYIDAAAGGVVCRGCGGASQKLGGAALDRLSAASAGMAALTTEDAATARALITTTLREHAGVLG